MSRVDSDTRKGCCGRSKSAKSGAKSKQTENVKSPKDPLNKHVLDGLTRSLAIHLCCPACDTLLLQPLFLPCGHCICQPCLNALRKKATSTKTTEDHPCARCKAPYSPLPGGAWAFPEIPLIAHINNRLLEKVQGLRKVKQPKIQQAKKASLRNTICEICPKGRDAQHYCRTCGVNYCAKCLKKLHSNRAFQAHVLTEPMDGSRREPCPAHPERSLSHCCLDDGAVGCQGCMEQGHPGHDVSTTQDARVRREAALRSALEHAGKVKAQCEDDMLAMDKLRNSTGTDGADLRRQVREGFLLLRNTLLDQEAALLSHLDHLTASTCAGASDFLQDSAPLVSSLGGLEVITEQALQEPDLLVFLSGAKPLTHWLHDIRSDVLRPAANLQDGAPFKGVSLDFDAVLSGLLGVLDRHLCWRSPEVGSGPGSPVSVAKDSPAPSNPTATRDCDTLSVVHMPLCPGTPGRGLASFTAHFTPSKLGMPAGDCCASEVKQRHLLARPPIIYQHNVRGATVEIFWMVPMDEEVDTFDVHFQDAITLGTTMVEERGVVLCGLKACKLQTAGLRPDTHYLFRARSVNNCGAGEWSSAYRVNTEHQGQRTKPEVTQEV